MARSDEDRPGVDGYFKDMPRKIRDAVSKSFDTLGNRRSNKHRNNRKTRKN